MGMATGWNAVVVDDRESSATTAAAGISPLGSGVLLLRLLVRLGLSCFMLFLGNVVNNFVLICSDYMNLISSAPRTSTWADPGLD